MKRTCQHRRQRWHIDTTTRRLHWKTRTRTDYSHQKQYWQHDNNRMTITWKQKWEKQLYGRFKRLINNISHEKAWIWLRKGNLKREIESSLKAAQNNAIRTNKEYLMLYNCKLFVLRMVTWIYNCLQKVIISYLKPYNHEQTNDYYH